MNTHENDTELDTAYWEGRAEEAKNSSALLAKSNERITALENELKAVRSARAYELEQIAGLMVAIGFRDAEIDTLRTELKRVTGERDTARASAGIWKRHSNLYRRFVVSSVGTELHNATWYDFKERFKDD